MEHPILSDKWNAEVWRDDFLRAAAAQDGLQLHSLRIAVYNHTRSMVAAGEYETAQGETVRLNLTPDIHEQTRFYQKPLYLSGDRSCGEPMVRAVCEDCLVTAKRLYDAGEEVCVLNMANRQTPGGGVLSGCGAQEEYLFRCSDYYRSLYAFHPMAETYGIPRLSESYPMHPDSGGIYTPGVTVFRGGEKDGYPLLPAPWKANFIAVAGINHPTTELIDGETRLAPMMAEGTKNKIRTIFRIAVDNAQVNLVLGALGCGAFRNPPKHVAELFRDVLAEPEFRDRFKRVFFSIIEDHNSRNNGNFAPFAEVFNPTAGDNICSLSPNEIFVFGSNLEGSHGAGAARAAHLYYGAVWGQGTGLQGQSYAIPTMHGGPETIAPYVDEFVAYAAAHPELRFLVTRIGCGIAGFRDEEIAPLFRRAFALPNVCLPISFQRLIASSASLL